jgi:DNA-binding protein HU-beta
MKMMDAIAESLAKGKHLTVVGFGTFDVKQYAVRHSINPTTKKPMIVPERMFPTFKASRLLKEAVAG